MYTFIVCMRASDLHATSILLQHRLVYGMKAGLYVDGQYVHATHLLMSSCEDRSATTISMPTQPSISAVYMCMFACACACLYVHVHVCV